MKRISKHFVLLLGFLSGFIVSLIGLTIEDLFHNNTLEEAFGQPHHFIVPVIIGLFTSLISFYVWKNSRSLIATNEKLSESEYKYRTLYENMTDVVCILDKDKNIIDINNAGTDIYEYSREELLKLSIDDLVYKEDKDLSNFYFEKLNNTGTYSLYEGRILTKSGKIKWIQVNSSEFIQDGKIKGSQDIIRDITKRKEIEIELENTIQTLNNLVLTKDKLFSIIAHDLREPFNSILGFSDLLLSEINTMDSFELEKGIKNINSTSRNTYFLLENLLNWAKTQSGKIAFLPEILDLKSEAQEALDLLVPTANSKNIRLENNISENCRITADKNMISTVFRNLISNSVKFTRAKGLIEISACTLDDSIEITVSDDGIGMKEETRNTLFSVHSNKSTKGTANEKGSGLGLILCKEFVEIHGGEIWAESELNRGSVFKFTLPLSKSI